MKHLTIDVWRTAEPIPASPVKTGQISNVKRFTYD